MPPPLPPGFVIQNQQSSPALPPGFSLVEGPKPSRLGTFLRSAAQGLTLNFADELGAGARMAEERDLPLSQQSMVNPFDEQLRLSRANLDAGESAFPKTALTGGIVGGVALGGGLGGAGVSLLRGATSIPSAIGRGAVEGALYGAAYGAGEGETAAERLKGAGIGAAGGAALGGAAGVALPGITALAGRGSRRAMDSMQSVGAARSSANLEGASPALRTAAEKASRSGRLNEEALGRQLDAETLPVPIQLTQGQATRDPALLSRDMNLRGKHPEIADRLNDQNGRLGQNIEALRTTLGENVFTTNPVEHADTIIAAYRAKDSAAQARIAGAYQKLRDANGGQFPVDAKALLDDASKRLHQQLLFDHAPPEVMRTLDRLAKSNSMTFENFESLRTNLARILRSNADGNVKAAAGVIRDAMEALPLSPSAASLKPIADEARGLARVQFKALEADPAYKAAVEGIAPDRYVQRYIVSAPRNEVAKMMENLDPTTAQSVRVAVLDHLRTQARLNDSYQGNFSAAGFNRALSALEPKLNHLFDAKTVEALRKLGRVSDSVMHQPKGSFVNNSNTLVASAADYGGQAVEGAVNVAFGGVPVGSWGRRAIESANTGRAARETLAPGAGVRLSREELRRRRLVESMRNASDE